MTDLGDAVEAVDAGVYGCGAEVAGGLAMLARFEHDSFKYHCMTDPWTNRLVLSSATLRVAPCSTFDHDRGAGFGSWLVARTRISATPLGRLQKQRRAFIVDRFHCGASSFQAHTSSVPDPAPALTGGIGKPQVRDFVAHPNGPGCGTDPRTNGPNERFH